MASPLPENSSSLTVLSSGQNTPKSSPGPDDPPSGQGSVPPPSTTLEGVPQVPFEDQVARAPTFLTTPQTEEDGLYLTAEMPMNKAGFSYIACAPSPIISPSPNYPFLRPIPSFPRTSTPSSQVHLSFIDRSPHLRISTDALTCSTPLGFRSGRANIPVRAGAWYCEMIVERGGGEPSGALDGSHVRLGWGRREAKLNSPVGLDGYSYGLRDKTGEKVTLSRPMEYFGKGFGSGDVVGMYISLPEIKTEEDEVVVAVDKGKGREMDVGPLSSSLTSDILSSFNPPLPPSLDANGASSSSFLPPAPPFPLTSPPKPTPNLAPLQITRHRIPIRYKNQLYFESIDPPVSKEMEALMEPPAPPAPPPPPPATITTTTTTNSAPSAPAPRKPTTITNKTLPSVDSMRPAIGANPLRPIPILKGSKIAFFINGESPGVAFEDLMDFRPLREAITKKMRGALAEVINGKIYVAKEGTVDDGMMGYYPFISSYGGGRVTFNPGPHYRFPPPDDIDAYLLDPKREHPRTSIPAPATKVKEDPSATEEISLEVPPPPPTEPTSTSSTDASTSNPNLSWTPLSSIYPSFHALQEALDERDEQLFIDSYIPDAPDPIPSALDIAARKRKSKDASSEPGSGESSSGGRKGQKGKKGVRVKSRLGLHDGLVDSFSPAPTNSEAGEESSESGSTPAPGGVGAVGGDASRLGGGGGRGNGAADELGSEDAMGEEEEDEDDEDMVVVGGSSAGGARAGPASSANPNPNPFTRNPQNGASYPPSNSAPILDLPQYQYQQQQYQLQYQQQQQQQQAQYQFQQQQFQQQQRYHSTPFPLPPSNNNNPAYFPPAEPSMPNTYSSYQPSFVPPQYQNQPQYPPQQQQYQQQPSFASAQAPNANGGGNDEEDEDGLGSEDAEGEMEESGDDEEGEGEGAGAGWEGGSIKEHVEETE